MKLIVIAALALFVALMDHARAAEPLLKPAPAAAGTMITFGDLFVQGTLPATLADIEIGPAPRPGRRSAIEAAWLEATARKYGIAWKKPPGLANVIISRAGQPVPTEHITATITEALKDKTSLAGVIIALEPVNIWIPEGLEPTVAVESLDYNQGTSHFSARLRAPADSGEIFAVYGRATPAKPVAVLKRDVSAGEVLRAEDVGEQNIEIGRIAQDTIGDVASTVGLSVKRQMRAGQKLRQSDVERPRMLKKGDIVTLMYEVPGMTLTAQGRAVTDAAAGDVISIVNSQSHRAVDARVTSAGTAIVEAQAAPQLVQPALVAQERPQ